MNRYKIAMFCATAFALFAGVSVATASSQAWTAAKAAATIKARYSTVDQKATDWLTGKLQKLLDAGTPETDPQVVALRKSIAAQLHAAKVTKASCVAVGKRFHCTATVMSANSAQIPPDYQPYAATVRLTFTLVGHGYRITTGWR